MIVNQIFWSPSFTGRRVVYLTKLLWALQTRDWCLSNELLVSYRRLAHTENSKYNDILAFITYWARIHFTFNNFDSPLFFIIDFPDMSLQSMIKQKAWDPTFDSAPLLSHLPSGWIWFNVSYCLGEIDGTQTPSLGLADILSRLPHTDWFCVWMCAHVLHFTSYWFCSSLLALASFLLALRPSVCVGLHPWK